MFKKTLKISLISFLIFVFLLVLIVAIFNYPVKNRVGKADLGVTFSKRYAEDIGLDWRRAYLSALDDLNIKKVRIPVYWDWVEPQEGEYNFDDVDWQLDEAKKRGVDVILVIGQKVPRWPECYVPDWIGDDDKKRKTKLLVLLDTIVERYKNREEVKYWQVENEPFLRFGICPAIDSELLDSEIDLVRSKDPSRKIMVTDSGELSTWIPAAKRADIFGTTMYRNVYKEGWGYYKYPLGPTFFRFKRWLIENFAEQDDPVVIELQAEPWIAGWTTNAPLEEQFKSMTEDKLRENIEYAKASDFSEVYLWGVEWWYWLREHKDYPYVWEEAKEIIEENS